MVYATIGLIVILAGLAIIGMIGIIGIVWSAFDRLLE